MASDLALKRPKVVVVASDVALGFKNRCGV